MSDNRQLRAQALYAARQAALAPASSSARADAAITLPAWSDLDAATQASFLVQADQIDPA